MKKSGKTVSEKVIRRIMKEAQLVVPCMKKKKYSSYLGEIGPEVENVINRDFHAEKPNTKWLTDLTEFHISAGKVYLSPMIDCFDGLFGRLKNEFFYCRYNWQGVTINELISELDAYIRWYNEERIKMNSGRTAMLKIMLLSAICLSCFACTAQESNTLLPNKKY